MHELRGDLRMQLEGNFPDPDALGAALSDAGAGIAPARVKPVTEPSSSTSNLPSLHSGEGSGEDAVSPASSPSRISVGAGLAPAPLSVSLPKNATLHSSSTSLPAVDQVPFLPDEVGAGLAPARSPEPDDTVHDDSCTLVQGSLTGVLR
jgi:hypothetical protein